MLIAFHRRLRSGPTACVAALAGSYGVALKALFLSETDLHPVQRDPIASMYEVGSDALRELDRRPQHALTFVMAVGAEILFVTLGACPGAQPGEAAVVGEEVVLVGEVGEPAQADGLERAMA